MICVGEGTGSNGLFLVGESPGYHESKQGRPFVGRSGEVLNEALNRASISRAASWITNLVKERPVDKNGKDRAPDQDEIDRWWPSLEEELLEVKPHIIVTLGATATRHFLPELDAVGGMETVHGVGRHRSVLMVDTVIFPVYHPAAGLHDPRIMSDFFWDIQRLGQLHRGAPALGLMAGPPPKFSPKDPLALDTEYSDAGPYCFTTSAGGFQMFTPVTPKLPPTRYTFHNALADLQVFDRAGMPVQAGDDSMVGLYNLNTEPKGLKEAVYRYFDHQMTTFEQVTGKADVAMMAAYFQRGINHPWPEWPAEEQQVNKKCTFHRKKVNQGVLIEGGCDCRTVVEMVPSRRQPISKRLYTQLTNLLLSGQSTGDIATAWKGLDIKDQVEAVLGPLPRATIRDVPLSEVKPYAIGDAKWTAPLLKVVKSRMDARLLGAYEMDMRVIPMIASMERRGLLVEREKLEHAREQITKARETKLHALREYAGDEGFNPASSDQVARVFEFDGIDVGKRTPGGKVSTSKNVLKALKGGYQFASDVYEFREAEKLLNTFIPAVEDHIQADGRIHPNFRITNTDTGRLSAHAPNLLAFPARTDLGKLIRGCFRAAPGRVLVGADLDQVEMRIMADESGDENMIRAILSGLDMHSYTASLMFGIPIDKVDKRLHRTPAKNTGFLVIFEGGASRLKESMEAEGMVESIQYWQEIINLWYRAYPKVRDYQRKRHNEAHTYGYVRDRWGRIRHVEAVWCPDIGISKKAEREASNFPIQAGAQGQIKKSMGDMWEGFADIGIGWNEPISPLLQIHDELILEVDEKVVDKVQPRVVEYMTDRSTYRVPITASSSLGMYWSDLK